MNGLSNKVCQLAIQIMKSNGDLAILDLRNNNIGICCVTDSQCLTILEAQLSKNPQENMTWLDSKDPLKFTHDHLMLKQRSRMQTKSSIRKINLPLDTGKVKPKSYTYEKHENAGHALQMKVKSIKKDITKTNDQARVTQNTGKFLQKENANKDPKASKVKNAWNQHQTTTKPKIITPYQRKNDLKKPLKMIMVPTALAKQAIDESIKNTKTEPTLSKEAVVSTPAVLLKEPGASLVEAKDPVEYSKEPRVNVGSQERAEYFIQELKKMQELIRVIDGLLSFLCFFMKISTSFFTTWKKFKSNV